MSEPVGVQIAKWPRGSRPGQVATQELTRLPRWQRGSVKVCFFSIKSEFRSWVKVEVAVPNKQ